MMTQLAPAQLPPITEAPPAITFQNWRQTRVTDISEEFSVSFPSSVTSGFMENNTIHVSAILPANRIESLPVVVILHYWGAADLSVERRMAAQLNRRNIAAVLVTLPYHLERTPKGRVSGALAIQPDPVKLIETMKQSVFDVRRVVDWVQTRPEFKRDAIGLSGTSLGAIVAATVAGVEPRIGPQCYMIGGVNLAHILWNSSRVVQVREQMRREGLDEATLREKLVDIEPATFLASSARRPALVIGARYDTIVPSSCTEELIRVLGEPTVQWLDTGHFGGVLAARTILNSQSEFFASEFAGVRYSKTKVLRAPTLRFGVLASGGEGIEVFGGTVLTKSKSGFSVSLLASPRQLRLFPAYDIDQSLQLGISIGRRVTPTLAWSFVL